MNWPEKSLANPASDAATVAAVTAIMLPPRAVTFFRLPIQLFPDIDQMATVVRTSWRASVQRRPFR